MFRNFIVFLLMNLFVFSSQSQAGILLEPFLGYAIGSAEDASSPSTDYSYKAPTFGARVGYQQLGLMLGAEYSTASLDMDYEVSGLSGSFTGNTKSQLGLFVGYNLPIMFRAWGTYYVSPTFEYSSGTELSGSGYGLGLGFTGLPLVSLNLEYRSYTYDEATSGSSTGSIADYTISEILLSVSLPLVF